jgi:peptide/nickel transport system permease protein
MESETGDPRKTLHFGLAIAALFLTSALVSTLWTPFDPAAFDATARLAPPSAAHFFGTDHFGRDVFANVLAGARTSLVASLCAVALGLAAGAPLGLAAAAWGGMPGEALMRAADVIFAFPALLVAVLLTATLGPGVHNAILAIAVFNVPVFARVARAGALSVQTREFILAARAAGKSRMRIAAEHIAPNVYGLLAVQAAVQCSVAIVAEAGLSYVGLGAVAPTPSWGRLLAEGQTIASIAPWVAAFPGLAIALCVIGFNFIGDGLRDALDPVGRAGR